MMENPFIQDDLTSQLSPTSDSSKPKLSYSDIADKLIRDKLWLTALELHAELIEAGKEVPKLRDFFSNPGNFENQTTRPDLLPTIPRSSSQATLDSLDFTRYSEDGERAVDERIAVLEFELRKAKETINALRATLTVATGEGSNPSQVEKGDPIKPHESRALNFLINEYLLRQGYKLTAITLADENENQDFDDWDDVGLNMPKPSELLHLYRVGIRQTETSVASVCVQTDPIIEITIEEPVTFSAEGVTPTPPVTSGDKPQESPLPTENAAVELQETSGLDLEDNDEDVKFDLTELKLERKEGERRGGEEAGEGEMTKEPVSPAAAAPPPPSENSAGSFEEVEVPLEESATVISVPSSPGGGSSVASRSLSTLSCEMSELPRLPQLEGYESFSYEELVSALSEHLPSLLHHVPLSNKEWVGRMVPLLVCLISLQTEADLRETLIQALLDLKKRPNQEDRSLILAGVMRVCETLSEAEIEKHLLPHCWELMSHKYPEKRALVAQACPHVSLYISRELRESLLISILKQLLEDKEELVRTEAVSSLAHIAAYMSRNYHQVEELTLKAVLDRSETVVRTALRQLCPVTGRWAQGRGRLVQFLSAILSRLTGYIKDDKSPANEKKERNIVLCLRALAVCLPLFLSEQLQPRGDEISPSPLLIWLRDSLIPELLDLLELVDSKRDEVITGFIKFFASVTNIIGTGFTANQVKSVFVGRLDKLETNLLQPDTFPNTSIIPVYVLGVLFPLQMYDEVERTVGRLLVAMGLSGAPADCLCLVARRCAEERRLTEPLLAAVWQGIVHPTASVKETACRLLAGTVPHLSEQLISSRILPPLVTLASDVDLSVRVSTLIVHTLIIECCSSREVVEKCYLETERIVSDGVTSSGGDSRILVTIISAVGRMAPRVEQTFREQVLLRELEKLTRKCSGEGEEVVAALVEAFSNTVYSQISKPTLTNTLLPALRTLEAVCLVRLPTHSDTVSSMVREVEARLPPATPTSSHSSVPRSGSSLSLTPGNVEDMKQKMTKIFSTPISTPTNLHNLFWKK